MNRVLCIPLCCDCGERMVWAADVQWLAQEGLDIAGSSPLPLPSHRQPLPPDARNVTGMPNARCARCFHLLPILPLLRARLAAGVGLILDPPSPKGGAAPRQPGEPSSSLVGPGSRLVRRDGRRGRRVRAEAGLESQVSTSFAVTIMDISTYGLCAEHAHAVHAGALYAFGLRLPGHPGPLRVQARARWTMPHRVEQTFGERRTIHCSGFEFVSLAAEAASALEAYVAARFAGGETEMPAATAWK